jgi:hypothetical protein
VTAGPRVQCRTTSLSATVTLSHGCRAWHMVTSTSIMIINDFNAGPAGRVTVRVTVTVTKIQYVTLNPKGTVSSQVDSKQLTRPGASECQARLRECQSLNLSVPWQPPGLQVGDDSGRRGNSDRRTVTSFGIPVTVLKFCWPASGNGLSTRTSSWEAAMSCTRILVSHSERLLERRDET